MDNIIVAKISAGAALLVSFVTLLSSHLVARQNRKLQREVESNKLGVEHDRVKLEGQRVLIEQAQKDIQAVGPVFQRAGVLLERQFRAADDIAPLFADLLQNVTGAAMARPDDVAAAREQTPRCYLAFSAAVNRNMHVLPREIRDDLDRATAELALLWESLAPGVGERPNPEQGKEAAHRVEEIRQRMLSLADAMLGVAELSEAVRSHMRSLPTIESGDQEKGKRTLDRWKASAPPPDECA